LLVEDMIRLSRIAKEENPQSAIHPAGAQYGFFAAQQYVLDHSREIDGLILSGSGALDGLARLASSAPPGNSILNAPSKPARTPFDWLSRDSAVCRCIHQRPAVLCRTSARGLCIVFGAAPRLSDPVSLRKIREDLPIYLFSGSEDPVGQHLEGVHVLIERYHKAGIYDISTISTPVDDTKCSMRSTAAKSGHTYLAGSLRCWKDKKVGPSPFGRMKFRLN